MIFLNRKYLINFTNTLDNTSLTEGIGTMSLKNGKINRKSYNYRVLGEDGYDGWFPLRQPLDNHIRSEEIEEYGYKYWINWKHLEY